MSTQTSGSATENVEGPAPPVVTSVSVTMAVGTMGPGGSDTATARLNGGALTTLPSNASIAWTSSNTAVATIPPGGNAGNPLQATVSSVSGGVSTGGTIQVTITATVTQ